MYTLDLFPSNVIPYPIIIFVCAEIEAFYENTRQLLDGEAAVFDAVRCRPSLDLAKPKSGQGCDGIDNDCDRLVDQW